MKPRQSPLLAPLLVTGVVVTAVLAPWLAPCDPLAQDLARNLEGPSLAHPLGLDKLGRDVLSRMIHGARASVEVGLLSVAVSLLIGVAAGAAAGLGGKRADLAISSLVDVLMAFPGMLLAIAVSAALGPGLTNTIIALAVIGWTGYARFVRGEVLRLRDREHVEAARALGLGKLTIFRRHIFPLLLAPLIVQTTFAIAGAIVAEAGLSFLGLGIQPPSPSWGSMLNEGRSFLMVAPHLTVFPGLAVTFTVLALNSLGDSLGDGYR